MEISIDWEVLGYAVSMVLVLGAFAWWVVYKATE